ncbi:hypothetical protein GCM10028824_41620 [Hymenobacter segetis]
MKEVPPVNLPYDYRNPTQPHVPPPALPRVEPAPPTGRVLLPRPVAPTVKPPRKAKRKVAFLVERTRTGYSAHAETHGINTVGTTVAELKAAMVEATNLCYQDEGLVYTVDDLAITPDVAQFFEYYHVLNPEALAIRIGMSAQLLTQLVRGHRKPTRREATRILAGLKDLGQELAALEPL